MNKIKPNIINTNRLELHSINSNDEQLILEIFQSEEVAKTYMLPKFTSVDEMQKLHHRFINLSNNLNRFVYGIYYENKLIGFVNDVEMKEDFIELGYVINPRFKSNGFMTEALKGCIDALNKMGYKTIRCGAFSTNNASLRVMEKAGMHKIDFTEDINYNNQVYKCIYCEFNNK